MQRQLLLSETSPFPFNFITCPAIFVIARTNCPSKSTRLASTTSDIESMPKKLNIEANKSGTSGSENTTPNIELWSGFGMTKRFLTGVYVVSIHVLV